MATNETVKVIFSAETIAARIDEIAGQIAARKIDKLLVVAVLTGSFVFAADLIRALHRVGLTPEIVLNCSKMRFSIVSTLSSHVFITTLHTTSYGM